MSLDTIKQYWDVHVLGNLNEYKNMERILSEQGGGPDEINSCKRACGNCVISLHQFRDYILAYIPDNHNAHEFFDKTDGRSYEKKIARLKNNGVDENIIKSLAILEDVADRYKHAELGKVHRNHEVSIRPSSFGELPWGEFKVGGKAQVIIELNNQERRGLEMVIDSVVAWWQTLIPELR